MSRKRSALARVMMVVALAAVTLAILRAALLEVVIYPTLWVLPGFFDFVIVWKLILNRRILRRFLAGRLRDSGLRCCL